mgnify:CR=1 FL=1
MQYFIVIPFGEKMKLFEMWIDYFSSPRRFLQMILNLCITFDFEE